MRWLFLLVLASCSGLRGACVTDGDCPFGRICVIVSGNAQCEEPCTSSAQCPPAERCATCLTDPSCPNCRACLRSACIP